VSTAEEGAAARVLRRAVPADHAHLLVDFGDRLDAVVGWPAGEPGADRAAELLAEALLAVPAEFVAVWTRPPGQADQSGEAGLRLATALHPDPLRRAALTAALTGALTGAPEPTPGKPAADSTARFARTVRRLVDRIARSGRPGVLPGAAAGAAAGSGFGGWLAEYRVGPVLAVPVWGRAEPIGTLVVAREPGGQAFDGDDVDLALVLGRRAGTAIETARLLARARRQAALLDAVGDAVIAVDQHGVVTAWNAAAGRLYGIGPGDAVGRRLADLVTAEPADVAAGRSVTSLRAAVPREPVPREPEAPGRVVGGSSRSDLEDELAHRATHDELTGLPNRAALMERLAASVDRLDGDSMLAVLFCDLDGFKDINDGLGHAVGDQVLVAVARRLRQRCRSADVVARFGGDEFVVVLPVPDVGRARAAAERLVEALSEPITVGDAEVAPGASIGVTVVDRAPAGDDPVGTLLRDADTAMYHAKERGRGRHELFDSRLRVGISARLEYAGALRRAIGNQELALRFQSRRFCADRRLAGVEALLRWTHPSFGAVPPDVFVPVAERTGRIVELGAWALRQALAEFGEIEDRRLTVSVNVSPRQLGAPRFVEKVDAALAGSGVEPWRVVLEITEGALVDDPAASRGVLTDLRRLGVTIALDDFGTGWSSMSYLRTLPVDVIKIDQSFVADLPKDRDACAVVSAVLGLGHGMGLAVVAEGVERADQLAVLRDLGCDEYQGFIDGQPAPLRDVLAPTALVATP
jgi:diguanylate cyclase (GGDEF)-like protein